MPVHLIITMMNSRLSTKKSLSHRLLAAVRTFESPVDDIENLGGSEVIVQHTHNRISQHTSNNNSERLHVIVQHTPKHVSPVVGGSDDFRGVQRCHQIERVWGVGCKV